VEQVVRAGTPLNFIKFRSGKGFLLHVAQTFDIAQPYLKSFHLAENMWHPHAWAGGVVFTDLGVCRKTLTQEKWDKVKAF
jgi:hypothetical protein